MRLMFILEAEDCMSKKWPHFLKENACYGLGKWDLPHSNKPTTPANK